MKMPECILLAGGRGTRLRPSLDHLPKAMAPVGDRPLVDIQLAYLKRQGVERVILSVGYKADTIIDHVGDGSRFGVDVRYVRERRPLGTGGAVLKAFKKLGIKNCFIINADTLSRVSLRRLYARYIRAGRAGIVAATRLPDCRGYGRVRIDASDRIISFLEKDNSDEPGYINTGVYLLNRPDPGQWSRQTPCSLEYHILPRLAAAGSLIAYKYRGRFTDIGTPEKYRQVLENARSGRTLF